MGKIRNPTRFTDEYGIDEALLAGLGAINPTLASDTPLFIDPILLGKSSHDEIRVQAVAEYENHFSKVIRLLKASREEEDVGWRSARKLMSFPEIKWTCLGYGGSSVSGSGSGRFTTTTVMRTAKEIVDLGVSDPDLFVAMAVFEKGIGPDRISDMTANVILGALLAYNQRILADLKVPLDSFTLTVASGAEFEAELPTNPFETGPTPVILVPADIVRDLPIAKDWSDIADNQAYNEALRKRVNQHVADLWRRKTLKDKRRLKEWAMSSQDSFEIFLELLRGANPRPYDVSGDPLGELVWTSVAHTIAEAQPLRIIQKEVRTPADASAIVKKIIEQFRFLIEERRLSEELYHEGGHRPERAVQRLFFAVAYAYCKANDLDITPEADTGNGPVDFKVSRGFSCRVLVEIKLSVNTKLVAGYQKQLEKYNLAEETEFAYYVVVDVGGMGKKAEGLLQQKNSMATGGGRVSEIEFIDGRRRQSASKL